MERLYLVRFERTDQYTLGALFNRGLEVLVLEPPWKDNQPNVSCVPIGVYQCALRRSPRFGLRYWVKDVPGRSWILVHSGNVVRHTKGCLLPGLKAGYLKGQRAVLNSKAAVRRLEESLEGRPFELSIEDHQFDYD